MRIRTPTTSEASIATSLERKRKKRFPLLILFTSVILTGSVLDGEAQPKYWDLIQTMYHPASASTLTRANCLTCHTPEYDDGNQKAGNCLNRFGADFKAQPVRDAHALDTISRLDSDGDGWPNGIELAGGKLPGDAGSHPAGNPPMRPAAPNISTATQIPGDRSVSRILFLWPIGLLIAVFLALLTGLGCLLCHLNWRILRLLSTPQTASDTRGIGFRQPNESTRRTENSAGMPASRLSLAMASFRRNIPLLQRNEDMYQRKYTMRSEINQRENNEDSFHVFDLVLTPGHPGVTILAIADGMGGHAHGEDVSREALRRVCQVLFDQLLVDRSINLLALPCPIDGKTLLPVVFNALQQADAHVRRMVEVNHWGKAGSTLVMAIVLEDSALVANLGDSPLFHYQHEDGRLTQITEDHTVAGALLRGGLISPEMAQVHEGKSRLEFFVGSGQFPKEPPLHHITLSPGDMLLLCSDGVSGSLGHAQIAQILTESYGDLERQADNLLKAALGTGETDNQTLILWQHPTCGSEAINRSTTMPLPSTE